MKAFLFLLLVLLNISIGFTEPNDSDKKKVEKALDSIVKKQLNRIRDKSNSSGSDDEKNINGYVLSSHIRSFSDIPKNIDHEIEEIKEQTRLLIRRMAMDIEVSGGDSGILTVSDDGEIHYEPNPKLPKNLNKKRESLLKANLKNSVSVRSAAMAIHLLANINEGLKSQAYKAKTRQQKEKVYILQAVYIYEMADITLELLNSLVLEGKPIIDKLHGEAKSRVQARIEDINRQRVKAKNLEEEGLLTLKQFKGEENTYTLMEKANEQSLDAWNKLILTVGKQQDFIANLKSKKGLIEYKRDKAKLQMETLRDLRQAAELRDAIGSLDDLVASVSSLDLLVLDERTVRVLLGYDVGD
jgi:hypothetical protein